jgi:hypothetical protein
LAKEEAMPYSKSYQQVVAGRVREDEAIGFFRYNKVAAPGRVFANYEIGGKKQPTVDVDYLVDTGVGKVVAERDPVKSAYNPNKYNQS